ncbi:MAG TPA: T9SS type A sorting domain-containing protein, partial [Bacteroidetes bacterium]|nr:T9SS type A sorting domain-containing protein [Bacteroidota bacterium]HEX04924.1 T9SS type A sorting domain-containing protein [Bacteroidota bacterium]
FNVSPNDYDELNFRLNYNDGRPTAQQIAVPPEGSWNWVWVNYDKIIYKYCHHTDLAEETGNGSRTYADDAIAILDSIAEANHYAYSSSDAIAFWDVVTEGWWVDSTFAANQEYADLSQSAINSIRSRDVQRPIAIMNWYYGHKKPALYPDSYPAPGFNPDPDPEVLNRLFENDFITGWDIFINEQNPFIMNYDGTDYFTPYHSRWYYKNLFELYVIEVMINDDIDLYNSATGLNAEWWMLVQGQRAFIADYSDPNLPFWRQINRRPTKNEYQMQNYFWLSAGAKGILTYQYMGDDFEPLALPQPPPVENDVNTILQQTNLDDYSRVYGNQINREHGLIATDVDDPSGAEFRQPFSAIARPTPLEDFTSTATVPIHENYSNTDGYYPYDWMADANEKLPDILQLLRPLKWYAGLDGVDDTMTKENNRNGDRYWSYDHWSIEDYLEEKEIDDKFGLRYIRGEAYYASDPYTDPPGPDPREFSNIFVGVFADPDGDPTAEYYFLVNAHVSNLDGNVYVDATVPDEDDGQYDGIDSFFAEFDQVGLGGFDYEPIWYSYGLGLPDIPDFGDPNGDPNNGDLIWHNSEPSLYITLDPGSALLFKRTPVSSPYTGPSTMISDTWWLSTPRVINSDLHVQAVLTIGTTIQINNGAKIIVEEDGKLLCLASALFEFDGGGIEVTETGLLEIDPDEDNVIFRGMDETGWQGITLHRDTPADPPNVIKNAIISDATIGVKLMNWDYMPPTWDYEVLENVEIFNCETGIESVRDVSLENVHIHDCETGVQLLQNNDYTCEIRGGIIENNDLCGIESDRFYKLNLGEGLILRGNGASGVYCNNTLINFDDLEVYNNGSLGAAGISLVGGTTVSYYFRYLKVVENAGPGILLHESSLNSTIVNGKWHTIGNNALNYRDQSIALASEILLFPPCGLNFGGRKANIFSNWQDASFISEDARTLLYNYSADTPKYLANVGIVWWGEGILSDTDLGNHLDGALGVNSFTGTGALQFTPTPYNSNIMKYWATGASDEDEIRSFIQDAYALLDSGLVQEAYDSFWELVQIEEIDALQGWTRAGLRLGHSESQLTNSLMSLQIVDPDFAYMVDRTIANTQTLSNDFDTARTSWTELIDASESEIDSLNSEIGFECVNITELKLIRAGALPDSGTTIQSHEMLSRDLAKAEERVAHLYQQIFGIAGSGNVSANVIPSSFALHAAYPNPFNPTVTIPFALPQTSDIKIAIYNTLGQRVVTLVNETMQPGAHQIVWEGVSTSGSQVASGIYFVQMEAPDFIKTQKILMLK